MGAALISAAASSLTGNFGDGTAEHQQHGDAACMPLVLAAPKGSSDHCGGWAADHLQQHGGDAACVLLVLTAAVRGSDACGVGAADHQ